ncbi:hypothetical protein PsYK624_166160 [Phanerochaete sordida]|uniref:Uncharacterized protein n=1 Tax=Phanerochaete sordida TaxID=48140 RepID=A0A9P3LME1_9APHY|nr:hypothetical protein PsYK624_166160 [Phanerochaete sordida]
MSLAQTAKYFQQEDDRVCVYLFVEKSQELADDRQWARTWAVAWDYFPGCTVRQFLELSFNPETAQFEPRLYTDLDERTRDGLVEMPLGSMAYDDINTLKKAAHDTPIVSSRHFGARPTPRDFVVRLLRKLAASGLLDKAAVERAIRTGLWINWDKRVPDPNLFMDVEDA